VNTATKENWLYVIIQSPGTAKEQLLGYTDEEKGDSFIPAFSSKEAAQQCFLIMPKDIMRNKYEIQAIIKEDLLTHALQEEYNVFMMDDKGRILEKLTE
jgi:hypothetical protein